MSSELSEQSTQQTTAASQGEKRQDGPSGSSSGASSPRSPVTRGLKQLSFKAATEALSPNRPVSPALRQLSYKEASEALSPSSASAQRVAEAGLKGASTPLDAGIASKVSSTTGVDLGGARKHTGPEAQAACESLGAEGFTVGNQVAFASPNPSAHTEAHEYAHVAQQAGTPSPAAQGKDAPAAAPSGDLEAEADAVADAALSGGTAPVSVGAAPQVARKTNTGPDATTTGDGPKTNAPVDPKAAEEIAAFKESHGAEMAAIVKLLKGHTSDGDCLEVLAILSHWDMNTITTAWCALKPEWLADFVDNIGSKHFKRHPREVVATFRAMSPTAAWKLLFKLTDTGFLNGVSAEEAHMSFLLLKSLPPHYVQAFRERGGDHWKEYCKSLPSSAVTELQAALDPAKEKDLRQREDKRRAAAKGETEALKDGETASAIERIKKNLKSGIFNPVTDAEARQVLGELSKLSGASLSAAVRELEKGGYIDKWLDNLPKADKFAKANVGTLIGILRYRPPQAALVYAEGLLETGLFDWAVTEVEAQMAYYLIRSQPPSVQAKFREKDNGAWLERMERNLKRETVTDTSQMATVDESGELTKAGFGTFGSQAELDAAKKQGDVFETEGKEGEALQKAQDAKALFEAVERALASNEATAAADAYGKLAAAEMTLRQAIVRRLDALGLVDKMLDDLGFSFIWHDTRRRTTISILAARDPMRSVAHVQTLLESGLLNVCTSEEAYLAFNLMKAMPANYREKFQALNPDWWDRMMGEMNDSQLNSDDLNMYQGGEDGKDRESLLTQLADEALWNAQGEKDAQQLANVIRMAIAAGHRRLANELAIQFGAFDKHPEVAEAFGFVRDMKDFTGDGLKTNQWYQEGAFQTIGEVGTAVVQGVDAFAQIDDIDISIKERKAELKGVELDEVQDALGGSISGMKFRRTDGEEDDVNAIDLKIQYIDGIAYVDVDAADLQLESIRYAYGDYKVETGAVTLKGLRMKVQWDVAMEGAKPTDRNRVIFELDELEVADLLVIMPDAMTTMGRFAVKGVRLDVQEVPVPKDQLAQGKGADVALSQLKFVPQIVGNAAGGMAGGKSPADEAKETPMMGLSIADVTVEGLTTSSGQRADRINVQDIDIKVSSLPSKHAHDRLAQIDAAVGRAQGRIAELKAMAQRTEVDEHELTRLTQKVEALGADKAKLQSELPALEAQEQRYLELYHRQRNGEDLGAETEEFLTLQKTLQGGATIDVGSFTVEGLGSQVGERQGTITATGISGSGQTAGVPGLAVANQMVTASEASKATELVDPEQQVTEGAGALTLGVDRVHAKDLEFAGTLPDYRGMATRRAELRGQAGKGLGPKEEAELKALEDWWSGTAKGANVGATVEELLQVEAKAGSGDPTAVRRMKELRDILRAAPTTIGEIDLRGVEMTVAGGGQMVGDDVAASGSLTVKAAEMSVTDVKSGDYSVGSVTGTDLEMGASIDALSMVTSGTVQGGDAKGHVKAGTLRVRDVNNAADGTHVDAIDVEGLSLSADTSGDGNVAMEVGKFQVQGVYRPSEVSLLDRKIADLEGKGELTAAEQDELGRLKARKQTFDGLRTQLVGLEGEVKTASDALAAEKDAERKKELEATLADAQRRFDEVKAQVEAMDQEVRVDDLKVEKFKVEASGIGNPLVDGYDIAGRTIGVKLSVGAFSVGPMRYVSPSMTAEAEHAGMQGAEVSVTVEVVKDDKGEYKLAPKSMLELFEIAQMSAKGLSVTMPVGSELVNVQIPEASMKGLALRGISLTEFDPMKIAGSAKVDEAQVKLQAGIGDYFRAQGELSLHDFQAEALSDGKVSVNLGGLTLEKLGYEASGNVPKGSLVESLKGSGGQITKIGELKGAVELDRNTGDATFEASLGTFALQGIHYAGGGHLLNVGSGSMTGTRLKGRTNINTGALTVDLLSIDKIEGKALKYRSADGAIDVGLTRGYFEEIRVKDFVLGANTFDFHLGKAGVEGLQANIRQQIEGQGEAIIKANATASISGLDIKRANNGVTTVDLAGASMKQLDVDATVGDKRVGVSAAGSLSGVKAEYDETNGDVSAHIGNANLAHLGVSGQAGGTGFDVNASGNASDIGFSQKGGVTKAHMGDGDLSVNGSVTQDGHTNKFALTATDASADFEMSESGFAVSASLGALGLNNVDFASGSNAASIGSAQMKGFRARVVGTFGKDAKGEKTVTGARIQSIAVPTIDVNNTALTFGDAHIKMPHGHLYGFNVTDLDLAVNDKGDWVTRGGSVGLQEFAIDKMSASVGKELSASASVKAKGLKVDFLQSGATKFRLEELTAQAAAGHVAGFGGSLERLSVKGLEYSDADGDHHVSVEEGGFTVKAGGETNKITVPGSEGTPATAPGQWDYLWSMPFLDKISGHLLIQLPIHTSYAQIKPVVKNGHVQIGDTVAGIHLPHEEIFGFFCPKAVTMKILTIAVGELVDFIEPEFTKVRGYVEDAMNGASEGSPAKPATPPMEIDLDKMSGDLVSAMGSAAVGIDILAPDGKGVLGTAGDFLYDTAVDWNPFNSKKAKEQYKEARAEEDFARRKTLLLEWARKIKLGAGLNAAGGLSAMRRPVSGGDFMPFLSAGATADFTMPDRTIGQALTLSAHFGVDNLRVSTETMTLQAKQITLDAKGMGGVGGDASMQAGGQLSGDFKGIDLRMKKDDAPADPPKKG